MSVGLFIYINVALQLQMALKSNVNNKQSYVGFEWKLIIIIKKNLNELFMRHNHKIYYFKKF